MKFSGKFTKLSGKTLKSVLVTVGSYSFTGSGESGNLTGAGLASGSFTSSGGEVTLNNEVGDVAVSWTYDVEWTETTDASSVSGSSTTSTTSTTVTSITVSQSGQNLTIRFNNGIQMGGKFTAVNQTASAESSGYDTYNAQFEVSSGKESKFVGTLNYDTVTGYRMIDGSWTWGRNTYDIHGVGSSWR